MGNQRLRRAIVAKDYAKVAKIIDGLRASGMKYQKMYQYFNRQYPMTIPEFEVLMQEVEEWESRA